MLLGKVIKLAMTAQSDFPTDVLVREPELAARLEAEAERGGTDLPRFVADTVSRFMAMEDGESWTLPTIPATPSSQRSCMRGSTIIASTTSRSSRPPNPPISHVRDSGLRA